MGDIKHCVSTVRFMLQLQTLVLIATILPNFKHPTHPRILFSCALFYFSAVVRTMDRLVFTPHIPTL